MTVADFRKRNAEALRRIHAEFVALCKKLDLLGGKRVGVDGSHFNGNASDRSFRSAKGLAQDIAKLEARTGKWHEEMDRGGAGRTLRRPRATPDCLPNWRS